MGVGAPLTTALLCVLALLVGALGVSSGVSADTPVQDILRAGLKARDARLLSETEPQGELGFLTPGQTVEAPFRRKEAGFLPRAIPDAGALETSISISGSDSLVATGCIIDRIGVEINITHPRVQDLDIFLQGPAKTEVELATDVRGGSANATLRLFDAGDVDSTGRRPVLVRVDEASGPLVGDFAPEEGLTPMFRGKSPAGTWTLKVSDDTPSPSGATQELLGFALLFQCRGEERVKFEKEPRDLNGDPVALDALIVIDSLEVAAEDSCTVDAVDLDFSLRLNYTSAGAKVLPYIVKIPPGVPLLNATAFLDGVGDGTLPGININFAGPTSPGVQTVNVAASGISTFDGAPSEGNWFFVLVNFDVAAEDALLSWSVSVSCRPTRVFPPTCPAGYNDAVPASLQRERRLLASEARRMMAGNSTSNATVVPDATVAPTVPLNISGAFQYALDLSTTAGLTALEWSSRFSSVYRVAINTTVDTDAEVVRFNGPSTSDAGALVFMPFTAEELGAAVNVWADVRVGDAIAATSGEFWLTISGADEDTTRSAQGYDVYESRNEMGRNIRAGVAHDRAKDQYYLYVRVGNYVALSQKMSAFDDGMWRTLHLQLDRDTGVGLIQFGEVSYDFVVPKNLLWVPDLRHNGTVLAAARSLSNSDVPAATYELRNIFFCGNPLGAPRTAPENPTPGVDVGLAVAWRQSGLGSGVSIPARGAREISMSVSSSDEVARRCVLEQLLVAVEVEHPRVGDLDIAVRAPDGTQALLWAGDAQQTGSDLRAVFWDGSSVPPGSVDGPYISGAIDLEAGRDGQSVRPAHALGVMRRHEIEGTWTLKVSDRTPSAAGSATAPPDDTRSIKSWALGFVCGDPVRNFTREPELPLGDRQWTVDTLTIAPEDSCIVEDVDITLNISHPHAQDLGVYLTRQFKSIEMYQQLGVGGLDGAVITYGDNVYGEDGSIPLTPSIWRRNMLYVPSYARFTSTDYTTFRASAFESGSSEGTWTLRIKDDFSGDNNGTVLHNWSLRVMCRSEIPRIEELECEGGPRRQVNATDLSRGEKFYWLNGGSTTSLAARELVVDTASGVTTLASGADEDLAGFLFLPKDVANTSALGSMIDISAELSLYGDVSRQDGAVWIEVGQEDPSIERPPSYIGFSPHRSDRMSIRAGLEWGEFRNAPTVFVQAGSHRFTAQLSDSVYYNSDWRTFRLVLNMTSLTGRVRFGSESVSFYLPASVVLEIGEGSRVFLGTWTDPTRSWSVVQQRVRNVSFCPSARSAAYDAVQSPAVPRPSVSYTFGTFDRNNAIPDHGATEARTSVSSSYGSGSSFYACPILSVKVTATIVHPRPEDLQLRLKSPAGKEVLLSGAGANGTVVFSDGAAQTISEMGALTPGMSTEARPDEPLSAFTGFYPDGTWTLKASDGVPGGVGEQVLRDWELELECHEVFAFTTGREMAIPDGSYATDTVTIAEEDGCEIFQIRVRLDLTHPHTDDLRVFLRSPQGRLQTLYNEPGVSGSPYNFSSNAYTSTSFRSTSSAGNWTLLVQDDFKADVGTLASWSLETICYGEPLAVLEQVCEGEGALAVEAAAVGSALVLDGSSRVARTNTSTYNATEGGVITLRPEGPLTSRRLAMAYLEGVNASAVLASGTLDVTFDVQWDFTGASWEGYVFVDVGVESAAEVEGDSYTALDSPNDSVGGAARVMLRNSYGRWYALLRTPDRSVEMEVEQEVVSGETYRVRVRYDLTTLETRVEVGSEERYYGMVSSNVLDAPVHEGVRVGVFAGASASEVQEVRVGSMSFCGGKHAAVAGEGPVRGRDLPRQWRRVEADGQTTVLIGVAGSVDASTASDVLVVGSDGQTLVATNTSAYNATTGAVTVVPQGSGSVALAVAAAEGVAPSRLTGQGGKLDVSFDVMMEFNETMTSGGDYVFVDVGAEGLEGLAGEDRGQVLSQLRGSSVRIAFDRQYSSIWEGWLDSDLTGVRVGAFDQPGGSSPLTLRAAHVSNIKFAEYGIAEVPDHGAAEVETRVSRSALSSFAGCTVQDMQVRVEVAHESAWDLELRVKSPSQREVLLWGGDGVARAAGAGAGAGRAGVAAVFWDNATVAAGSDAALPLTGVVRPQGRLRDFFGEDPEGTWVVKVSDGRASDAAELAERAQGVRAVELLFACDGPRRGYVADVGEAVPDGGVLVSTLEVAAEDSCPLRYVDVSVDIPHRHVKDVYVYLTAPNREARRLYFGDIQGRDGEANVTGALLPQTTAYRLDESAGAWELRVYDDFGSDLGSLASWNMTLTCEPEVLGVVEQVCEGEGALAVEAAAVGSALVLDGSSRVARTNTSTYNATEGGVITLRPEGPLTSRRLAMAYLEGVNASAVLASGTLDVTFDVQWDFTGASWEGYVFVDVGVESAAEVEGDSSVEMEVEQEVVSGETYRVRVRYDLTTLETRVEVGSEERYYGMVSSNVLDAPVHEGVRVGVFAGASVGGAGASDMVVVGSDGRTLVATNTSAYNATTGAVTVVPQGSGSVALAVAAAEGVAPSRLTGQGGKLDVSFDVMMEFNETMTSGGDYVFVDVGAEGLEGLAGEDRGQVLSQLRGSSVRIAFDRQYSSIWEVRVEISGVAVAALRESSATLQSGTTYRVRLTADPTDGRLELFLDGSLVETGDADLVAVSVRLLGLPGSVEGWLDSDLTGVRVGAFDQPGGSSPLTLRAAHVSNIKFAEYGIAEVPDHGAAEVETRVSRSALSSFAGCTVQDMQVRVEGAHESAWDLELRVKSPSQREVLLWGGDGVARAAGAGAGRAGVAAVFWDNATVAAGSDAALPLTGVVRPQGRLRDFFGEDPEGTWVVKVSDGRASDAAELAERAQGVRAVELSFACDGPRRGYVADVGEAVPDGGVLVSTLEVAAEDSCPLRYVDVSVDIPHRHVKDVYVYLTAPNREARRLYFGDIQGRDGEANVTGALLPQTTAYRLDESAGAWELRVYDDFGSDLGSLASWNMTLTCEPEVLGVVEQVCEGEGALAVEAAAVGSALVLDGSSRVARTNTSTYNATEGGVITLRPEGPLTSRRLAMAYLEGVNASAVLASGTLDVTFDVQWDFTGASWEGYVFVDVGVESAAEVEGDSYTTLDSPNDSVGGAARVMLRNSYGRWYALLRTPDRSVEMEVEQEVVSGETYRVRVRYDLTTLETRVEVGSEERYYGMVSSNVLDAPVHEGVRVGVFAGASASEVQEVRVGNMSFCRGNVATVYPDMAETVFSSSTEYVTSSGQPHWIPGGGSTEISLARILSSTGFDCDVTDGAIDIDVAHANPENLQFYLQAPSGHGIALRVPATNLSVEPLSTETPVAPSIVSSALNGGAMAASADVLVVTGGAGVDVFERDAQGAWSAVDVLPPPVNASTNFGARARTLAVIGDNRVFVSDPGVGGSGGAVFSYVRAAGGSWVLSQKLASPDAHFGAAVDVAGDDMLVVMSEKSLHVYASNDSSTWKLNQTLELNYVAPNGEPEALAVSPGFIAVADVSSLSSGYSSSFFVYEKSADGRWTLMQRVYRPDTTALAFSDNELLVGKEQFGVGSVTVFPLTDGFTRFSVIQPVDNRRGGNFGASIVVRDGTAVLAAPGYASNCSDGQIGTLGALYVMNRAQDGAWLLDEQPLLQPCSDDFVLPETNGQVALSRGHVLTAFNRTRLSIQTTESGPGAVFETQLPTAIVGTSRITIGGLSMNTTDATDGRIFVESLEPFTALAGINGRRGTWTLKVHDSGMHQHAAVRHIVNAKLRLSCSGGNVSRSLDAAVPDNGKLVDTIEISNSRGCLVDGVRANLDIKHRHVKDLVVYLGRPDGVVERQYYGDTQGLDGVADLERSIHLGNQFSGRDVSGKWTLHVYDDFGSDLGSLLSWSLTFACRGKLPASCYNAETVAHPLSDIVSSSVPRYSSASAGTFVSTGEGASVVLSSDTEVSHIARLPVPLSLTGTTFKFWSEFRRQGMSFSRDNQLWFSFGRETPAQAWQSRSYFSTDDITDGLDEHEFRIGVEWRSEQRCVIILADGPYYWGSSVFENNYDLPSEICTSDEWHTFVVEIGPIRASSIDVNIGFDAYRTEARFNVDFSTSQFEQRLPGHMLIEARGTSVSVGARLIGTSSRNATVEVRGLTTCRSPGSGVQPLALAPVKGDCAPDVARAEAAQTAPSTQLSDATAICVYADERPASNRPVDRMSVPRDARVTGINITVDLEHTDLSRLSLDLVSPIGTAVPLVRSNSTYGMRLARTRFSDAAADTAAEGDMPYRGAYRPMEAFAGLVDEPATGSWCLQVRNEPSTAPVRYIFKSFQVQLATRDGNHQSLREHAAVTKRIPDAALLEQTLNITAERSCTLEGARFVTDVHHTHHTDISAWFQAPTGAFGVITDEHGFKEGIDGVVSRSYGYGGSQEPGYGSGSLSNMLRGTNNTGLWKVWVQDDFAGDVGSVSTEMCFTCRYSAEPTCPIAGRADSTQVPEGLQLKDIDAAGNAYVVGQDSRRRVLRILRNKRTEVLASNFASTPEDIAVSPSGVVYVAVGNQVVRIQGRTQSTFATMTRRPMRLAVADDDVLFVATDQDSVLLVTSTSSSVFHPASFSSSAIRALTVEPGQPRSVLAAFSNGCVQRLHGDGTSTPVLGVCGRVGRPIDGDVATKTAIYSPEGVAVDRTTGDIYVSDYTLDVVLRVRDGRVKIVAGQTFAEARPRLGEAANLQPIRRPGKIFVDTAARELVFEEGKGSSDATIVSVPITADCVPTLTSPPGGFLLPTSPPATTVGPTQPGTRPPSAATTRPPSAATTRPPRKQFKVTTAIKITVNRALNEREVGELTKSAVFIVARDKADYDKLLQLLESNDPSFKVRVERVTSGRRLLQGFEYRVRIEYVTEVQEEAQRAATSAQQLTQDTAESQAQLLTLIQTSIAEAGGDPTVVQSVAVEQPAQVEETVIEDTPAPVTTAAPSDITTLTDGERVAIQNAFADALRTTYPGVAPSMIEVRIVSVARRRLMALTLEVVASVPESVSAESAASLRRQSINGVLNAYLRARGFTAAVEYGDVTVRQPTAGNVVEATTPPATVERR
ncbi:unnamed protein product [Pedinophyceae sp. YPF-701]|nr:unnamed protein product [Pedinophyceae sp. YPF-701]